MLGFIFFPQLNRSENTLHSCNAQSIDTRGHMRFTLMHPLLVSVDCSKSLAIGLCKIAAMWHFVRMTQRVALIQAKKHAQSGHGIFVSPINFKQP